MANKQPSKRNTRSIKLEPGEVSGAARQLRKRTTSKPDKTDAAIVMRSVEQKPNKHKPSKLTRKGRQSKA